MHITVQRKILVFSFLLICVSLFVTNCSTAPSAENSIRVIIQADGSTQTLTAAKGITVSEILSHAAINLTTLDRVEPPVFTQLNDNSNITVVRVREEYETEDIVIQFERQTVRNESLPEGQTRLIQAGENGTQQITYRTMYEDDLQISKTVFKTTIISESRPEIVMVGVQTPFTAIEIPGTIAYLSAGNAWVMEQNTGNRRPVVTTGDLDGRIFDLSPDGHWLLFTRKISDAASDTDSNEQINQLFVVNINNDAPLLIDLRIPNIIHHAAWVPGTSRTITYSTVEPRSTAPGWQANNDLMLLAFSDTGMIVRKETIIETNSGGIYGWWGTSFTWSTDGNHLAYARPDSIGYVDFDTNTLNPLVEIIPLQTRGDWAWVPGVSWAPGGDLLYFTSHGSPSETTTSESSQTFQLNGMAESEIQMTIINQTGMFAYPVTSPEDNNNRFEVAFLQAIFPEQSETSRYRLLIMDQDGSNLNMLFPEEGSTGVQPQQVVWGMGSRSAQRYLGAIYQGNLWIIALDSNTSSQITGDGSIVKIDWN